MKKSYSLIVIPKMTFPMFLDRKTYAESSNSTGVVCFLKCLCHYIQLQRVGTDATWTSTLCDAWVWSRSTIDLAFCETLSILWDWIKMQILKYRFKVSENWMCPPGQQFSIYFSKYLGTCRGISGLPNFLLQISFLKYLNSF